MLELQQMSDMDNGADIVQRITAMLDSAHVDVPAPTASPASSPSVSPPNHAPSPGLAGHHRTHFHHQHPPPMRSLSLAPRTVLPPHPVRTLSEGENPMSITDLLGLNVPRGSLLSSSGRLSSPPPQLYDPPLNSRFFQDEPQYLDMMDASGFHTPLHKSRAFRSSPSYSDSASPICMDQSVLPGCNNGGSSSNSPMDPDLSPSSVDAGNLASLINYFSLNKGNDQQSPPQQHDQMSSSLTSLRFLQQQQQQQQHNLQANYLSQLLLQQQSPPDGRPAPCFPPSTAVGLPIATASPRQLQDSPQQRQRPQVSLSLNPQQLLLTPTDLGSPLQWQQPPSPIMSQSRSPGNGGNGTSPVNLERVARFHKHSASMFDATCTWSGTLPLRANRSGAYSCKMFLGGVPWDIGEAALVNELQQFGKIRIEWPGKEQSASQPKGYVYAILESEMKVKEFLSACTQGGGSRYFRISSKKMKAKEVEVIPWLLSDSTYIKYASPKLDPQKTVFVGALHGMINAEGLAKIMNDLFGGVIYAGIDTDKYKYPIGSGRVTFNNTRSYMKAILAAFIEIKTPRFTKKVQIDPYLEDSLCSSCGLVQGVYFCRDMLCYRYFCRMCWIARHSDCEQLQAHRPLMRNSKVGRVAPVSVAGISPPLLSSPSPVSSVTPPSFMN